ncbi:hypothetical protein H5154_21830 [Pseudoalteromonas sp. SR44-5]|uniref:MAE_28990/MAE_18760 family HEPN-like nuclease n=1 Tax=Pseudoalteromonas sp. SR44-5 TaxID=2760934 RepID=UPI001602EA83|nr:MAE_28990/MAE_18760 family HEPN-like nuclease [Pseudoalteromonas sp. SR44-5]MBB1368983.1 hypothetical protein [Pseudoalteromonas sp. SR44-5]
MKVRSLNELQDKLQEDLAWRRREFTTLKFMVSESRKHQKDVLLRSSIALLYSHWEGHIKHCALVYICYLKQLAPKYKNMQDNFFQLSLGNKFNQGFSIKKFPSQKEIFDYISSGLEENFDVNETVVIDTESNLKYAVIYNILSQLGLDTSVFELKENFIDSKLLKCRNSIAHGDKVGAQELLETYNELEAELLEMITTFQNLVINSAENKSYLKQPD